MKQIRQRLTYANVMSSLAVFLVLGGATAFAASKITAKQLQSNSVTTAKIKKNAVTSSKIKNNSITTSKIADKAVTGAKIDPASLGTVPSATNATNATNAVNAQNANNANTVNGQKIFKVNYRADEGSAPTVAFSALGLTITGACAAGNDISVIATTSKAESSIYSFVGSDLDPENPEEDDLEGGGFSPGVNFDLLAGGNGNINFVHFEYDALDGTIATGTLAIDENGTKNGCLATGDVTIG